MSFDAGLHVPWGYGTSYKALGDVEAVMLVHYHPEYVRRLLAWLTSKAGTIGIGGTWRPQGGQPAKPGFAPEGKSFHQDQAYNDGFVGACAVDLVAPNGTSAHRAPRWDEVPRQGSPEALRWGVHCNIASGTTTEPWHMQPIEIDGWLSWWNAGRPAPVTGYVLPGDEIPPSPTPDPTAEATMLAAVAKTTDGAHLAQFTFRGPIYTVGETDDHDVTTAEVFGRGGGRAYDIVGKAVVSWSTASNGSWGAVKATKTVADVRKLMGEG